MDLERNYCLAKNETNKLSFNKYVDFLIRDKSLPTSILNYVGFGVRDIKRNIGTSYSSHNEWIHFYYKNNFIGIDPTIEIERKSNLHLLTYSELSSLDKYGAKISYERKKFGFNNGVIIMHRENGFNYSCFLATDFKKIEMREFYKKNQFALNNIFNDFKNLIHLENSKNY